MKQLFTITFLIFCFNGFGQVTKEIKPGVLLTFPEEPEYYTDSEGAPNYRIQTKSYFIMSRVSPPIPELTAIQAQLKKAPPAEKEKFENEFLDMACKQMFDKDTQISSFKLGKYQGRMVKTKMKLTDEDYANRFIKLVLIDDRTVVIEAGYIDETEAAVKIKNDYLNSLKLK